MTDLNELKKLALASTPVGEVVRYEHGGGRMFNGTDLIADTFEEADREFYAVARQECLDLIARLERAENALEPFTFMGDEYIDANCDYNWQVERFIDLCDIRAAREALKERR